MASATIPEATPTSGETPAQPVSSIIGGTNPPFRVYASPNENPNSPYYIHPSDNPAQQVIFEIFNGVNYNSWCRAVLMSMQVKHKSGFLDGSIVMPAATDEVQYIAWVRVNSLVLSWVLNSISPSIRPSLLYLTNPRDLWLEVQTRYAKSDGPRVLHLEKSLSTISKGNSSVTEYYNLFKTIWDEYVSYRPLARCSCGLCTCNLTQNLERQQDSDSVIKFLVGLDDSYAPLRSQLLLNSPLPSLARVFSLLIQEESSRTLTHSQSNTPFESVAMNARKPLYKSPGFKDKKKPVCTHCGYTNHTIDKCFQLVGYPPGWKGPRGPRPTPNPSANTTSSAGCTKGDVGITPSVFSPLLSTNMFEEFQQFVTNRQGTNSCQSSSTASVVTNALGASTSGAGVLPASTGPKFCNDWIC